MARRLIEDQEDEELLSLLDESKNLALRELQSIGLDRVAKLERVYGPKDLRVKKAKLDAFFNAYAILGTVRYAAQVCGLNPKAVSKLIKNSDKYRQQFEASHDEFCQYLEQTAIIRAVKKSDSLLQFLLRANNPRKFSERMRIQALQDDNDEPLTIVFGECDNSDTSWHEPNYAIVETIPDLETESQDQSDTEEGEV
jgi:hypothetical protein